MCQGLNMGLCKACTLYAVLCLQPLVFSPLTVNLTQTLYIHTLDFPSSVKEETIPNSALQLFLALLRSDPGQFSGPFMVQKMGIKLGLVACKANISSPILLPEYFLLCCIQTNQNVGCDPIPKCEGHEKSCNLFQGVEESSAD